MTLHLPNPVRIKLVSKTLSSTRASKLRVAWFLLGTGFGVGCSMALTPVAMPHMAEIMTMPEQPVVATLPGPFVESAPTESAATETQEVPLVIASDPSLIAPPAEPAAPAAPAVAVTYPQTQELTVASGDTFVTLLGKAGVSIQESHTILDAMGKKFNARSLGVNDKVSLTQDKVADAVHVSKLSLGISNVSSLEVTRDSKGDYKVSQVDLPVEKKLARAGGKIDSSLYNTVVGSGLPTSMVAEIIKAYSYDVDFQREIQNGDSVDVVFERMQTTDGKVAGYGNIIYASLDLGDRDLRIYRYTDKLGFSDYYTAKGESVRKALLRTPINGARISSGFGMRSHPILGYSKMHKGVDFAAPMGTPIYASGDGSVTFVGRKGGYGNYLQIKHNGQYASAYAHLSRFASGIAPGKKVKQGQIIAYVGSTGASTGPHLHYEILMSGMQVNPANVKFKTGTVLAGNELKSFKRNIETLNAQLNTMGKPSGKIAMLELKPQALSN